MLDSFLQWCYHSRLLGVIRDSTYGIPVVQSIHLVGITFLLGSAVVLNFRLLNIGMRGIPLVDLARNLLKWMQLGMYVTILSGVIIFITDPVRYATSNPFRIKMALLLTAIIFQYAVFRKVTLAESSGRARIRNGLTAFCSLTLWFGVGWAGRAIAFFR
jgi:hypothetical protein